MKFSSTILLAALGVASVSSATDEHVKSNQNVRELQEDHSDDNVPSDDSGGGGGGGGDVTAGGDPHIKRFNGAWYDFMGECDLVFLRSDDFAGGLGLNIQVRTKAQYSYSFIETAAIKIGDAVMEVSSYGSYILDGISNAELPGSLAGYVVTHEKPSDNLDVFTIDMSNEGQIVVQAYKNLVSITLSGIKAANFEESVGLLGHYKTGDMLARDGKTIINDADAFGNEWQVHPDEDGSFFQTKRAPVYPTECHMPDPNKKPSRRLGAAAVDESAAIEACASANWNEDSMERCVYDVLATQDLGMAAAGIF